MNEDEKIYEAIMRHMKAMVYIKLKDIKMGLMGKDLTEYGKECLAELEAGLAAIEEAEPDVEKLNRMNLFLKEMAIKVREEGTDAVYRETKEDTV